MISGVEIPSILNTNSTRFCWKFSESRKKVTSGIVSKPKSFQPSNFVILVLWTSRDQIPLDFLSRSQLIVMCVATGSSSFNNKIPIDATPTPLHSFSQKLDRD